MNRKVVEENLDVAYKAIKECKIVENGKINSTFRSYISQFGVSVVQGSVLAALSFYNEKEKKLVDAIMYILSNGKFKRSIDLTNLLESTIIDKEDVINASIALKLALNLYEIDKQ